MSRFMLRAAVFILLVKNNKVLLAKRCNTDFYDGYYNLPCGHIDGGETAKDALNREAKEEVGVEINKHDVELAYTLHRFRMAYDGKFEYIDLFFRVKKWKNEPENREPDKCDDLAWFDLNNLPKNLIPFHEKVMREIGKGEIYGEIGFE